MEIKIPKGYSEAAKAARRKLIRETLSKLENKDIKCPCLGGVPVKITSDSINEIVHHAAKSAKSTAAVLLLEKAVKFGRFVKMTLPKDNKKQRKMKLLFMYVLEYKTPSNESIKITVGVREKPIQFLQYCITVQE